MLFVDDEIAVIEGLTDVGVPALVLTDIAGMSDADLADLIAYSATRAQAVHRAHAAAAGMTETPTRTTTAAFSHSLAGLR